MADAIDESGMPFPVWGWRGSHAIPDLARVPEDRWPSAFASTPSRLWDLVAHTTLDLAPERRQRALELRWRLEVEAATRRDRAREAARTPAPLPGTVAAPAVPDRALERQVNFRLPTGEHARLCEAAELLGLRPAQLARMLTLRGVGQVLAEARSVAQRRATGA